MVPVGGHDLVRYDLATLPKTNMDPNNDPLKDGFPLPTNGSQGPC